MLTKVFNFLRSFSLWVWVVMAVVGVLLASNWERITPFPADAPKPFHEQMLVESKLWTNSTEPLGHFITARKAGSLVEVGVAPDALFYTLKDGKRYATSLAQPLPLAELESLQGQGVKVAYLAPDASSWLPYFFIGAIILSALTGLLPRAGSALTGRLGGSSVSDIDLVETPTIRFADVVGAHQAKTTLLQVKSFLTDPAAYAALGAKPYRGVLLEGPPGTGKTLLAKALAGECGANFISVDGSHFSSSLMGVGIDKVSALFKKARENAPCIVFIDEFDGLGKRSSDTSSAAADEDNRIINKLLVELDGFATTDGVIVLAATNHRDRLDEAILRDGRFDATVRVELPTMTDRRSLFDMYLGKVKSGADVDATSLARMSSGMSPAAIAGVVNRAAVLAADARCQAVSQEHILRALETKQLGGEPNGSRRLSEKTRQRIAVHEAGHALVAHMLSTGIVERVSIEPRGQALGVTYVTQDDEDDSLFVPTQLTSRLAMMLAGREAELMVLGITSSGASDDLRRATELATTMVGRLGFSESFGLLSLEGLPSDMVSADVRSDLLKETSKILGQAQAQARACLTDHRQVLDALTDALLRDETIGAEVLKGILPAPTVH